MKRIDIPCYNEQVGRLNAMQVAANNREDTNWGVYSPALHGWMLANPGKCGEIALLVPKDGIFETDSAPAVDVNGKNPFFEQIRRKYGMDAGVEGFFTENSRAFLTALGKGLGAPVRAYRAETFGLREFHGVRLGTVVPVFNTENVSRGLHLRKRHEEIPGITYRVGSKFLHTGTEPITGASLRNIKGWTIEVPEAYVLQPDEITDLCEVLSLEERTGGVYPVTVELDDEGDINFWFENNGAPLRFDFVDSGEYRPATVFLNIVREFVSMQTSGPLLTGLRDSHINQTHLEELEKFRLAFNRFAREPIMQSFYADVAAAQNVPVLRPTEPPVATPVLPVTLDRRLVQLLQMFNAGEITREDYDGLRASAFRQHNLPFIPVP